MVFVLSSDGFPEAVGIYKASIGGRNENGRKKKSHSRRKYEALADFLMNRTRTVKKTSRKSVGSTDKGRTEQNVFARLFVKLKGRVIMEGDLICGDTVYGSPYIRRMLATFGVRNASPSNEAHLRKDEKIIARMRDAAVYLLSRLDLTRVESYSSEEFAIAHALSVVCGCFVETIGGLRRQRLRWGEVFHWCSSFGYELSVLILFAWARNIRAGRGEGFNGNLRHRFGGFAKGGCLCADGFVSAKRALFRLVLAIQLLMFGEEVLEVLSQEQTSNVSVPHNLIYEFHQNSY